MPSKFRYTLDNSLLSYEQREFYERNGYLLVKNLIEDDLLDECISRFKDICNGKVDRGSMTLMKDISLAKTEAKGEFLYYKVQDIVWDNVFCKYIMHPKLLDYVECFTGPKISAMHSMLINKPPDSGKLTSIHPFHQDLYYFSFRPVDRIVAAWTAMELVNEENGCLLVVPGTHKGELLKHGYPKWENGVNKAFHGITDLENHNSVSLRMEKGDTVFFHPLLIHGSGPNLSSRFRKAISCHYSTSNFHHIDVVGTIQQEIAQELVEMARRRGLDVTFKEQFRKAISCHYSTSNFHHIDVVGTIQQEIAQELIEMARRRGLDVTFKEVWEYRLRVVRGTPTSRL